MHLLALPRYQWFLEVNATDEPASLSRINQQLAHLVLNKFFTSMAKGKHI